MKLDGLDHPKTLDFAARLDVILPQAIGHLELLWAFVAQKTPHGNVGKWPDGAIARASQWSGDPTVFVTALCEAGFIDEHPVHRYIVHDWQEHAPRWVTSKLSRAKESFCVPHSPVEAKAPQSEEPDSSEENTEDDSGDYSPDDSADSKPSQAKPSQATPSEGESPPPAGSADKPRKSTPKAKLTKTDLTNDFGIPEELAVQFLQIRKDKRLTLTPRAMDGLLREFEKAGLSVVTGIELCCRKSWGAFNADWDWQGGGPGRTGKPPQETPHERGQRMARERGIIQ